MVALDREHVCERFQCSSLHKDDVPLESFGRRWGGLFRDLLENRQTAFDHPERGERAHDVNGCTRRNGDG